ncbi:MAG: hypothetical protein J0M12_14690, partial [Deltaproteobacteria bacterium]|nr:hypothetical protein [Deltaproteobacteria bacterium]
LLLSMIAIFGFSPALFADSKSDFYIQQAMERYFTVPEDARSLSTAGAASQLCEGAACIYMNAAGLGFMNSREVVGNLGFRDTRGNEFLQEGEITQSEWSGFISGAYPISSGRYGTFSAAYSRFNGQTNDSINTNPDGHNRTLGYGLAVTDSLAFGYSLTFLDDQVRTDFSDLHSHARFLHLFSSQAKLADGYMLGGTFRLGIGQSDTEDFELGTNGLNHVREYSGNVALSKKWDRFTGMTAFSYSRLTSHSDDEDFSAPVVLGGNEAGNDYRFSLGGEYAFTEQVTLRGGYSYRNANYEFSRPQLLGLSGTLIENVWSLGLGYLFSPQHYRIRLNYGIAYSAEGNGDMQQLIDVAIPL